MARGSAGQAWSQTSADIKLAMHSSVFLPKMSLLQHLGFLSPLHGGSYSMEKDGSHVASSLPWSKLHSSRGRCSGLSAQPNQPSYPSHCMRWKNSQGVTPNSTAWYFRAKNSTGDCWEKGRVQMFSDTLEKAFDQIHRVRKILHP